MGQVICGVGDVGAVVAGFGGSVCSVRTGDEEMSGQLAYDIGFGTQLRAGAAAGVAYRYTNADSPADLDALATTFSGGYSYLVGGGFLYQAGLTADNR